MFAILSLRSALKRFINTKTLACVTFKGEPSQETVVRINKLNFITAEVEFIDEDMVTSIQTGTISIASITSIRGLSTYMARVQLLNSNPDLLLEDSIEYLGHDCEEYLDIDEE